MIRDQLTTVVKRPIDEVFAYLADFDNTPKHDRWVTSIEKTSEGPVAVGSTWRHVRVMGRRSVEAPIELVEYEPNRRISIRSGSKGIDVHVTQSFREVDGASTEVTEELEMRTSGMMRLAEPMIRRQVPKQSAEVHARFKEILEGG